MKMKIPDHRNSPGAGFIATPQRLMRDKFCSTRGIPLQWSPWWGWFVFFWVCWKHADCGCWRGCEGWHSGGTDRLKVCSWAVNWIWSLALRQVSHNCVSPSSTSTNFISAKAEGFFLSCGPGIDATKTIVRYDSRWDKEARLIATAAGIRLPSCYAANNVACCVIFLELFFHSRHMARTWTGKCLAPSSISAGCSPEP